MWDELNCVCNQEYNQGTVVLGPLLIRITRGDFKTLSAQTRAQTQWIPILQEGGPGISIFLKLPGAFEVQLRSTKELQGVTGGFCTCGSEAVI